MFKLYQLKDVIIKIYSGVDEVLSFKNIISVHLRFSDNKAFFLIEKYVQLCQKKILKSDYE